MKKDDLGIDPEILARGLRDGFGDKKALMTDEEMQSALMQLKNDVQKHQQEKYQATLEKNKAEGDAFLAANKAKAGVVTLPSGLQYKVLQEGTGPKPAATDTVECRLARSGNCSFRRPWGMASAAPVTARSVRMRRWSLKWN